MALTASDIPRLVWLEVDLEIEAKKPPRRAHPVVVLEALLKGAFEGAALDPKRHKQLWHRPQCAIDQLGWRAGDTFTLTVQLFGVDPALLPAWRDALHRRFTEPGQNFALKNLTSWRVATPPEPWPPLERTVLNFLTPVPLPHQPGTPQTALDPAGFLHLCQTRLRKLFGREGALPPPPEIDTSAWRYHRITHRSRSQRGHPMFLNGCIGPLLLEGPSLPQWRPWLALFAAVGIGERLSFSQGRFLRAEPEQAPEHHAPPLAAPLKLRRPFLLDAEAGANLSLENSNLVVHRIDGTEERFPLMRLSRIDLLQPVRLTSGLLHACAEQGIPVLLAEPGEEPLAVLGSIAEARRNRILAQHHAVWNRLTNTARTRIARALVDAKLQGYARLIQNRYRRGDHTRLEAIRRARERLEQAQSLAIVRGWEGWASRHHFRWWAEQAKTLLGPFPGRSGKGAQDPLNALLNYGYALLRHRVTIAVRQAGLDPYLGILHTANDRHEALVSDLMEPFRPEIDRLVLRLINLGMIRESDLTVNESGVRLLPSAKNRYLQAFAQLCEGSPQQGGAHLATRIEQLVASYELAVLHERLDEWQVGDSPLADDETSLICTTLDNPCG